MKKLKYLLIIVFLIILSCGGNDDDVNSNSETQTEWKCGFHNGKQLWTGPRGGCYYNNSNGNKTYVDRSECNC
jgi:hypothetical protein|tara:strand:- start:240 stop:458 length:219 start_codon:yes stop_codon:yes gene_type:complete